MLLEKYRPQWADDFLQIKRTLHGNIQMGGSRIEHIGSTSIVGLAAKPIVDIDLVYKMNDSFVLIKSDLEKLGYYHNGNQGIHGREVFKRIKANKEPAILDLIDHHLYVCHNDNKELRRHLLFRDYLLANEKERIEYEKLKFEIAHLAKQDKKEYAKFKEAMAKEFIESIIYMAGKDLFN